MSGKERYVEIGHNGTQMPLSTFLQREAEAGTWRARQENIHFAANCVGALLIPPILCSGIVNIIKVATDVANQAPIIDDVPSLLVTGGLTFASLMSFRRGRSWR